MYKALLILALTILLSAGAYIVFDIYRSVPVAVAATEEPGRIWLPIDGWHWDDETIHCVDYLVGHGDSLWSIVNRYYPDSLTGEVVWAIRVANNLTGPDGPILRVGQKILIPDPDIYGVGRE